MAAKRALVVSAIKEFWNAREEQKRLDGLVKEQQPEVIVLMQNVDPNNDGIVWNEDDPARGTAFVQQNSGTEVWDEEAIITYLKKHPKLWAACSSQVLDIRKFEAEVGNGNIPAKVANKFKDTTTTPRPFIRFGKAKKTSR